MKIITNENNVQEVADYGTGGIMGSGWINFQDYLLTELTHCTIIQTTI